MVPEDQASLAPSKAPCSPDRFLQPEPPSLSVLHSSSLLKGQWMVSLRSISRDFPRLRVLWALESGAFSSFPRSLDGLPLTEPDNK